VLFRTHSVELWALGLDSGDVLSLERCADGTLELVHRLAGWRRHALPVTGRDLAALGSLWIDIEGPRCGPSLEHASGAVQAGKEMRT
jgi:hypothetical protein